MRILIIGPNQPRNGSYFHDATYMFKKKNQCTMVMLNYLMKTTVVEMQKQKS